MEEQKDSSSSETELSDSWTVVDKDDSDGNVNAEIGETSDSESLEVLEVEQEETDQNSNEEDHERKEENICDDEYTTKNCDDSSVFENQLMNLASVQKERKYVHHPSAYINMWLSIVMVVAIAITLGLGIGHYIGSKRFARAKDMIHHLQYENQMLERELADVVMKNNFCENDKQNRVRLEGELKQSELPNSVYHESYYLQGNMYKSFMHGHEEDVCYAKDNPFIMSRFEGSFVNATVLPVMQWFTYINDQQSRLYPLGNCLVANGSYISTNSKGDAPFDVISFSKKTSDKLLSKSLSFAKLNTQLTHLHSLLKKWVKFHENVKFEATATEVNHTRLQNMSHLPGVTRKVTPVVSESCNKIPCENVKLGPTISSNGFCRSEVNQCILHKGKLKNKERTCKTLSKAQLLCSLLLRSKNKSENTFLNRKQKAHGNKMKTPEASKFAFEKNRNRRDAERKLNHKKRKENTSPKFRMHEENKAQKHSKDNDEAQIFNLQREYSQNKGHKYSTSDAKRIKKTDKLEKSFQFMGNKENSYHKHKNFAKEINVKGKKGKQGKNPVEKQAFIHFQQQKKKQEKLVKIPHKHYKKYESKNIFKIKSKKHDFLDKREYYDKTKHAESRCMNNAKDFKKHSNNKGFRNFPTSIKKISEDKHFAHSKLGSSENSYICKTMNNSKKNGSESSYLKYPVNVYKKDKNFQKNWKEKCIYQINMKEMKILKS